MSVDPPRVSKRLQQRLRSRIRFLSDPEGRLLDALGIRHRNGNGLSGADIAFPTAVLVDGSGRIRWTFQSDTYRQRARPEQVFAAIADLPAD